MEMAKKTVILLMVFTLTFALIFIVSSLLNYSEAMTSFPWWACFAFAAIYFGPVLLFEGGLYLTLVLFGKWKNK